jgi:serine protease SohB
MDGNMTDRLQGFSERAVAALGRMVPKRWRGIAVVPVVRLAGVIGFATPLKPGLTLSGIARALDRAFKVGGAKAVAVVINSPGGSAVQSHLIFRRIRDLSEETGIPVLAFVEDVAASGGYMIACAADEIICDGSSIVGSIGVVGASFGLHEAIRKLGIERRVYTAGDHKVSLDPFLPENPDDVARLKAIQRDIHEQFIGLVRARRAEKLTGPEAAMFSGEYWSAKTARDYGLIDQIGDIRSFLRGRFGEDVAMPLVSAERGLFGRRTPGVGSGDFAIPGLADEIVSAIETRAIWARFGL